MGMEHREKSVSTQMQLRAMYQAKAAIAAASGTIPAVFEGDPTFAELVSTKVEQLERQNGS